jgi:predicted nucleic acid-binding protein
MTVLVDTGVLYADHDTDATRHDTASEALDAVYDGVLGQPYVSDFLYDEAVTLTMTRVGSHKAARTLGRRGRGADAYPGVYELVNVDRQAFEAAVECFERYDDQSLSFTDATTVALCERRGFDGVLSFDDDFDGLVDRFDPAEIAADR